MAGPPDKIEASELWALVTTLPRPHRVVDFPRRMPDTDEPVCKVALWPLTQEEQMICNSEADRFAKQILKESQKKDEANLGYQHTYSNEVAVQVLFRAARDPKDVKKPFFPATKALRHELTTDEVTTLFELYCAVQLEVGPIVSHLSKEELEAWVRRLEEGGSAIPFAYLAPQAKDQLLLFMASQLVSFWTDTSSAGSPQDGGQSEATDPLEAPPDPEPLEMPSE